MIYINLLKDNNSTTERTYNIRHMLLTSFFAVGVWYLAMDYLVRDFKQNMLKEIGKFEQRVENRVGNLE